MQVGLSEAILPLHIQCQVVDPHFPCASPLKRLDLFFFIIIIIIIMKN